MLKKVFMLTVLVLVGAGFWTLAATPASAEYPPSPDTVALAASNPNPSVGDTVSIAAAVADASGSPLAGVDCTFSIATQPGTDASVDPEQATTDEDGIATTNLNVGSTDGTILVTAQCGDVISQVSVVAAAAAAPPASLPSAGSGPYDTSSGPSALLLIALVLLLLAGGSGALYLARRAWR